MDNLNSRSKNHLVDPLFLTNEQNHMQSLHYRQSFVMELDKIFQKLSQLQHRYDLGLDLGYPNLDLLFSLRNSSSLWLK